MKSFVVKKLTFGFLLCITLALIFSGIQSWKEYQHEKAQLLPQYFQSELAFVQQLKTDTSATKRIIDQTATVLSHLVTSGMVQPKDDVQDNKLASLPAMIQIDLARVSVSQNIFQPPQDGYWPQLVQHRRVYTPLLNNLANTKTLSQATVIVNHDNLFGYLQTQQQNLPTKLLQWISANESQLVSAKSSQRLVFPPPFWSEETAQQYALLPIARNEQGFVTLVVKFNSDILLPDINRYHSVVGWHHESRKIFATRFAEYDGVKVSTSRPITADSQVTSALPQALHQYIDVEKLEATAPITRVEHGIAATWFTLNYQLYDTPYRVIVYADAEPSFAKLQERMIWQAAVVFGNLVFWLLLVFGVLTIILAYPTSNLIRHIEQQSAVFDGEKSLTVKGWEPWFDKVTDSFSDNRKLLQSLMDKNRLLDSKVQARTQELQSQTFSKDRNIALNRAIMNSIPDMIYYKNIDGGFLGCNSAFEYFAQRTEADLVTCYADEIFDQQTAEELSKFDYQALKSKRPYTSKSWHTIADNKKVLIHWLVTPVIDRDGEVLGLLGLGRDITQQEATVNKIELARAEAEQANQLKSEFIANMSHEIRTPMNAVLGMMDLVRGSNLSPLQASYINIAQTSARHLLNVINDLLDFSRVSAGKVQLHNEVFAISEVFDISFSNSLAKAFGKNLLLDIQLSNEFPEYFIGDALRLNQIFTNLIGNAVKFTSSGSVILSARVIEQRTTSATVEFCVTDTGVGIAKDKQQQVFEAFSQADSSVTREFGGTGLGLAIVYQLVEMMAGKIELHSELNKGSQFVITLPLKLAEEQPDYSEIKRNWVILENRENLAQLIGEKLSLHEQSHRILNPQQKDIELMTGEVLICRPDLLAELSEQEFDKIKRRTVDYQPIVSDLNEYQHQRLTSLAYFPILTLPFSMNALLLNQLQQKASHRTQEQQSLVDLNLLVVDDNEINQQVLSLILSREGANVRCAANGEEALSILRSSVFDAVIMDIQMPVMDGLTCAKKIRNELQLTDLPIIAMTAHTGEQDQIETKISGMNLHLSKPIDKEVLIDSLRNLLQLTSQSVTEAPSPTVDFDNLSALKYHFDVAFLTKQFHGDEKIITGLLNKFLVAKGDELEALSKQIGQQDLPDLAARLHNVKGMLGNLGAKPAFELTKLLEHEVKSETVVDSELSQKWQVEIQQLLEVLRSFCRSSD